MKPRFQLRLGSQSVRNSYLEIFASVRSGFSFQGKWNKTVDVCFQSGSLHSCTVSQSTSNSSYCRRKHAPELTMFKKLGGGANPIFGIVVIS